MSINKCVFGKTQVTFLYNLITGDGEKALPEKLNAIRNSSKPAAIKQLRRFFYNIKCLPGTIGTIVPDSTELQTPSLKFSTGLKKNVVKGQMD